MTAASQHTAAPTVQQMTSANSIQQQQLSSRRHQLHSIPQTTAAPQHTALRNTGCPVDDRSSTAYSYTRCPSNVRSSTAYSNASCPADSSPTAYSIISRSDDFNSTAYDYTSCIQCTAVGISPPHAATSAVQKISITPQHMAMPAFQQMSSAVHPLAGNLKQEIQIRIQENYATNRIHYKV